MGIANILRICGVLHIAIVLGLIVAIFFSDSWFPNGASVDHIGTGKNLSIFVLGHGVGLGIILILASFIKDVASAKLILLGEIVLVLCMMLGSLFTTFVLDTWSDGPPPPVWVILIINLLLCLYGRFKVNRI
ncbi:hypothetical protein FIM05_02555 [SAR202 cluster bacterium AD-802-K11_MRT_200m]|nr:hypothetical protein [SAR202 cluster bacterium AD-802-K11_MRT_200m]